MKKGEFISVSKRMVKEYFNRYLDKDNRLSSKDIQIIGFNEEENRYGALLIIPDKDVTCHQVIYEVVYNIDSDSIQSYIYNSMDSLDSCDFIATCSNSTENRVLMYVIDGEYYEYAVVNAKPNLNETTSHRYINIQKTFEYNRERRI